MRIQGPGYFAIMKRLHATVPVYGLKQYRRLGLRTRVYKLPDPRQAEVFFHRVGMRGVTCHLGHEQTDGSVLVTVWRPGL